ncbi:MAG TPA: AgmX/PglI C-terminal domain-containing protein [Polyangiaceae bacterium]|nr:AgmX/PglI C-terminal domain-containing protein [Polyangiaceae bacterium]
MSETTPPVPKHGGSGPFILAAIVMLLLMGGLIFWKLNSGGGETAKVETPKPSATPDQPVLDEPPPPPPPPPVASTDSSATPDDSSKPGTKKLGSTAGGSACGVCSGEPNPALQGALGGKAGQSRACYEKALSTNSTLSGRMTVSIKINQQGAVCSAAVKSDLNNPLVENCVLQSFRSATFPAPKGGCVEASVPLYFKPKT